MAGKVITHEKLLEVIKGYFEFKGTPYNPRDRVHRIVLRRFLRPAKELLQAVGGEVGDAHNRIRQVKAWAVSRNLSWSLETVVKRFLEDNSPDLKPYYLLFGKKHKMTKRNDKWYVLVDGELKEFADRESKIIWE